MIERLRGKYFKESFKVENAQSHCTISGESEIRPFIIKENLLYAEVQKKRLDYFNKIASLCQTQSLKPKNGTLKEWDPISSPLQTESLQCLGGKLSMAGQKSKKDFEGDLKRIFLLFSKEKQEQQFGFFYPNPAQENKEIHFFKGTNKYERQKNGNLLITSHDFVQCKWFGQEGKKIHELILEVLPALRVEPN